MDSQPAHLNLWFKVSGFVAAHTEGASPLSFPILMADPAIARAKQQLRRVTRSRRRELNSKDRSALDRAINQHLLAFAHQESIKSLAAFWPFDGEPDVHPAMKQLASEGVGLSLPVLHQGSRPGITMHRWAEKSRLKENQFGIPEPAGEPPVELQAIDLLIIPLVAWDNKGGRLGMGAGFYDRLLAPLQNDTKPQRLGLAYSIQEVAAVPVEEWDIPLHGVICERGCTLFG